MSQYPPPGQPWGLPPEGPQQPPFYNQPTEAYQQPQQGYTQYPQQPPLVPSPRRSGFKVWWNTPSNSRTLILGCLLPLCLVLCIVIASVSAFGGSHGQATATPTATPSQAAVLAATSAPTNTPTATATAKPTATPTPTPTPKPVPTQRPTPTPTHCAGVNNNPWCYDFNPGNLIYVPPSGFCSYFNCIASFYGTDDPGDGYVVQCVDGTYSQSGSERGACSGHGGVGRSLYSH